MEKLNFNHEWAYPLSKRVLTDYLILHHAAADGSPEAIHQIHLRNGWAGIAYHYYVRKDGRVYIGRPEWAVGGHTSGQNYNSLGICFEGNFEKESMSVKQLLSGVELIEDIKTRFPSIEIKKHRDFCATACPGKNFPFEKMIKGGAYMEDFYESLGDVPESYKPTITKLMNMQALVGSENPDPNSLEDNVLNISETYCRVMTTLDRLGKI